MKIRMLIIAAFVLGIPHLEATPIAIIGGERSVASTAAYAALVAPDGTLTELSGAGFPTTNGLVNGVAINSSGSGIFVGNSFTGTFHGYAAIVAPDGTLTSLSGPNFPSTSGNILSVAINNAGMGIIGGSNNSPPSPAYAALVAPNGTLTELVGLPPTNGSITSVGINKTGAGLISGVTGFAAFVAPSGALMPIVGVPATVDLFSAGINNAGTGIIGGIDNATNAAYATLVASSGTLTIIGGLPPNGIVNSVAISSTGTGIVGGQDNSGMSPAFAVLVAPNGTITTLSGSGFPATAGFIQSVAINSSGAGIIGGQDQTGTKPAYAALVAPNGTLTQLSGLPTTNGGINSVAINNAGVGIIGGGPRSGGPAFAALVAPNGTLTQLSGGGLPTDGFINAVGIASAEAVLNVVTPRVIGVFSSVFNTQLIAAEALEVHLTSQNSFWRKKKKRTPDQNEQAMGTRVGKHVLVAAAGDDLFGADQMSWDISDSMRGGLIEADTSPPLGPSDGMRDALGGVRAPPLFEYKARSNYTVWFSPFGDYIHQSHRGSVPEFRNKIVGGLVGFDFHPSNYLVGGGLGYAHNFVHYGQHLGHGNLNQEMAFAYYGYYTRNVWFNVAGWGGIYQFHNKRFAPFLPSTSAHINGWIFNPHGEVATPIDIKPDEALILEPFALADWVNTWQDSFTERGKAGMNVHMKDHYASLLRSEAGVRFYETLYYNWGELVFEEKASYVNRAPFHNHTQVNFVASASSFPVVTNVPHVQNLGAVELRTLFLPENQTYPYGIIDAQVELGSSFQSYFLSLELGKNF